MGHAKRCSLIADELSKDYNCNFAVFPSCIPMVTGYGFDAAPLVARSPNREFLDPDIINYARLERLTQTSDMLMFDGGYVFDSVVRSIVDNQLDAFWIRRGLWSASQNNSTTLDRQKYFKAVFVPTEAFDELNQTIGTDNNTFNVGPIVQKINKTRAAVRKLRKGLFKQAGRDYDKILVSMLGGGVASDRSAILATIINSLSAKPNVLHVIVVWPAAKINPQIYSRKNTLVLRTFSASVLLAAADLFVSAVGYNSFHEVIYNQIPTIFIPQTAAYMDDQRARAQAAVMRGLADMVEPWEHRKLSALIDQRLSNGSTDLTDAMGIVKLPKSGQSQFKSILEEVQS
jgi:predicted glycosyltransferase